MLLGCIADDFTGATDLANTLVRAGMRTVQTIGVPASGIVEGKPDAVVVALKSRTIPAADAIARSLAALDWLQAQGARQIYFKYCSTFDSSDSGNIGPVAEALMKALGTQFTIACPAFPANKRTIYLGHLFVGDELLSESPMREHPLTPMRDANLVRVLQRQATRRVGLVPLPVVKRGAEAVRAEFAGLAADGFGHAIVDAVADDDLLAIGAAFRCERHAMYVIVVDFTIRSQELARFMSLMLENAKVSRDTERGCLRFDVCRDPAQPERVFLYELYVDRAAFDAHLAAAHFRSFDSAVSTMVASKAIRAYDLVNV